MLDRIGNLLKLIGYHLTNLGCHIADGMSLDEYMTNEEVCQILGGMEDEGA